MTVFIMHLKCQGIGCFVSSLFIGCLLYADDILLLSPSVAGLQNMLDCCSELANLLSLELNVHKVALYNKMSNDEISAMILCDNSIGWNKTIKYLGVHLQSGKALKFYISLTGLRWYN